MNYRAAGSDERYGPPAGPLPDLLDPDVAERVVQQLFRAAMEMHVVAGSAEGEAVTRLEATLDELDRAVEEIRDAALEGRRQRAGSDGSQRDG